MLDKICERCSRPYRVAPSRSAARYCCKECYDAAQTGPRKIMKCAKCGDPFSSKKDHGAWAKYCNRECFEEGAVKPDMKACGNCGGMFLAQRSSHGGLRLFCTKKCYVQAQFMGAEKTCVNCGALFRLSPSTASQRPEDSCCSPECSAAYYVGERASNFKCGAYTHTQAGETHYLLPRPGYVGKYMAGRRVAVSRIIGRMVRRGEVVITINRDPNDWRPENLYLCESNSEFSKRRQGSLPWPSRSNLDSYATRESA